jgi:hypothetical protein
MILGATVGLGSTSGKGLREESKQKITLTAVALLLLTVAFTFLSPAAISAEFFLDLWWVPVLLLAATTALIREDRRIANAYNTALFLIASNTVLGFVIVSALFT